MNQPSQPNRIAALVKAAHAIADDLPLLDRTPYRTLATILPISATFLKAAAFAFPSNSVKQNLELAVKVAAKAVAIKKAGLSVSSMTNTAGPTGMAGGKPMAVTTPQSFSGSPAAGASFGR